MINYNDPVSWEVPDWHPDYGDAKGEMEHLRNLARNLIEQFPRVKVGLSVPEAGLMFLLVDIDDRGVIAEIYSIRASEEINQRKYGVFLCPDSDAEEEYYKSSIKDVVEILSKK